MDGKYTQHADPAVDAFIQGQLDVITGELVRMMNGDLESVVLSGGFGRGEGSIRIDTKGIIRVVNDYDIDVVYRERFWRLPSRIYAQLRYRNRLKSLADKLAEKLDIKQIDLQLRAPSAYARTSALSPRLAEYDTRYGYRLLYGAADPVRSMPPFKASDIPAFEGTWLLRNRGVGLLLARLYLHHDQLPEDKREYFYIEVNKAILAMGDALFIASGTYNHSYARRRDRIDGVIPEDCPHGTELARLYRAAAEYKLIPVNEMYPGMTPAELWTHVNGLYSDFFLYYEHIRTGRVYSSLHEYTHDMQDTGRLPLRRKIELLAGMILSPLDADAKKLLLAGKEPIRSVICTFLLLNCYKDATGMDNTLDVLFRTTGTSRSDWLPGNTLYRLTRAFLLAVHPKGELGRFLGNG